MASVSSQQVEGQSDSGSLVCTRCKGECFDTTSKYCTSCAPETQVTARLCNVHQEPITLYCKDHADVFCTKCRIHHRSCLSVKEIREMKEIRGSRKLKKTIESLEALHREIKKAAARERDGRDKVIAEKREATETVNSIYRSVQTGFKQKEDKTLAVLDLWKQSMLQMTHTNISTLAFDKAMVEGCQGRLGQMEMKLDADCFVDMIRAQARVLETEPRLCALQKQAALPSIQFAPNPELVKFLDSQRTFADIQSQKDDVLYSKR